MQILGHEKAFKDLNIGKLTYYEKERENHLKSIPPFAEKLKRAQTMLYEKPPTENS